MSFGLPFSVLGNGQLSIAGPGTLTAPGEPQKEEIKIVL